MSRKRVAFALLLLACAAGAWLYLRPAKQSGTPIADEEPVPGVANTLALAQGWTRETRERASTISFGSRLLPYAWFLALEQAQSPQAFRSDENLARLGFLPSARSEDDPDALPVGVVRTRDTQGRDWVGLGCAACHTGEVRYRGRALRIAGGAGRLDLTAFEQGLLASMQHTGDDEASFARFAARVLPAGAGRAPLRAELAQRTQWLRQRMAMNATAVPYGHGRMDAFGQIFNAAGVEMLGIAANAQAPDAPVSIPVLWSTPRMARVQWNGSSPNSGVAPLAQNVTTALGVYGTLDPSGKGGLGYASSAKLAAMGDIQRMNGWLRAPRWPQDILGRIDPARARRGAALYAANCQGCHALPPGDVGQVPVKLVPVAQVGTDARMARNFLERRGATGPLQGRKALVYGGAAFGARARKIDLVVHLAIGATARHPLSALDAVVKGRQGVASGPEPGSALVYKARPLDGIWSSAPYLHNGSIPSLHDLLLPPAQRPARFGVGAVEFDPRRVGLAAVEPGPGVSLLDTRLPGNGNGGHSWGTSLPEADRQDLLDFLKGL